jgi:hypothetical protein
MRRYPVALLGATLLFGLSVTAAFSADPPPEVQAANKACLDKGLKPPSDAFAKCVKSAVSNP